MLMKIGRLFKKQKGIGLLELMLSLAIISVLLVMATRYYKTARHGQQVNDGLSLVNATVAASENWVVGKSNYQGIDVQELVNQGLLPADIGDGSSGSPWHTKITVASMNNDSQVEIDLENIPTSACNSLKNKLSQQMDTSTGECGSDPTGVGTFKAVF